jgi:protein involved in polysaccharide export with SLBB domain
MTPSSLEIEACLDRLAQAIEKAGGVACAGAGYLPLYQRLEDELELAEKRERAAQSIQARLRKLNPDPASQSLDQTEERFSAAPFASIPADRSHRLHG